MKYLLLLGPTQPKALSVQAFIEYNNPVLANRPYAMVYNILITLIALILTWLYYKAFEKLINTTGDNMKDKTKIKI